MVAEDGSNGAWRGNTESSCSTYCFFLLYESAEQKAEKPKTHEGLWLSSLLLRSQQLMIKCSIKNCIGFSNIKVIAIA